jgi:hypothetical protein
MPKAPTKPPQIGKTPANANSRSIRNLELESLGALCAYTAYDHKISEAFVRKEVAARFGVNNLSELPVEFYEDAIRFLADYGRGLPN